MRFVVLAAIVLFGSACEGAPRRAAASEPAIQEGEFVASSRGQVYYWVGCDAWRPLAPANRRYFRTRAEAEAAGYRASGARGCRGPGAPEAPAAVPAPTAAAAGDSAGCTVRSVSDGDTLRCTSGERVRLLLIDAPESSQGDLGLRAKLALEEMVPPGSTVRLELDVQQRDRYGRLLAHVHSADGVWVNREMVRRGYALVLVYPPNVRHAERLRDELATAREAGRGLWAEGGFACAPAERRRKRC